MYVCIQYVTKFNSDTKKVAYHELSMYGRLVYICQPFCPRQIQYTYTCSCVWVHAFVHTRQCVQETKEKQKHVLCFCFLFLRSILKSYFFPTYTICFYFHFVFIPQESISVNSYFIGSVSSMVSVIKVINSRHSAVESSFDAPFSR